MEGEQPRRVSRAARVAELLLVLLALDAAAVLVLAWLASQSSWATVLIVLGAVGLIGLGTALLLFRTATRYWSSAYGFRPVAGASHATVRTADGCILNVETDGSVDAPITVVFVHGVTADLSVWHHQRESLLSTPYRAITYDARGHGKSSYVPMDGSVAGVRQLAADLADVIDEHAATGSLVLVGHSMGGMTIFALADTRPDLIARTSALMILNSTPGPYGQSLTFGLPKLFAGTYLPARRYGIAAFWLASLVPQSVRHMFGLGPYLIGMRVAATYANQPREAVRLAALGIWHTPGRVLADCARAIMCHDEQRALAMLPTMPVVVLAGRNDRIVTLSEVHRWAPAVPHVRLTIVDACGHMTPLEQPDVVTEHLHAVLAESSRHLAGRARPESATAEQSTAAPSAAAAPRPRPRPRPAV